MFPTRQTPLRDAGRTAPHKKIVKKSREAVTPGCAAGQPSICPPCEASRQTGRVAALSRCA